MDYIVSVKGVSKSYGEVQALKDVCFEVKPGEIFGLIGPAHGQVISSLDDGLY